MTRPLHIEYSGAVYHVTSRGNARNDICRDERDRANLVELHEHWKWGSYRVTAGVSKVSEFLTADWLLSLFGTEKKIAQQQYRKFVRAGISKKPPWDELDGQVLLGSKGFVKQFKDLLKEKENLIEIPRKQRYVGRPDIKEIFAEVDSITKTSRNEKIYEAHIKYGYILIEVLDFLGFHYTTVRKIVRRLL